MTPKEKLAASAHEHVTGQDWADTGALRRLRAVRAAKEALLTLSQYPCSEVMIRAGLKAVHGQPFDPEIVFQTMLEAMAYEDVNEGRG